MFRAIGRWFKALGYLLTGRLDAARRTLDTNPHVVRAKYDEIIREKTDRIHQYKQAVAGLIAQQENKMAKIKSLGEDLERLERLKAGALAKAKQKVEELTKAGKSQAEIKSDPDYMKCLTAYNDFSSTVQEKQDRITELERDVQEYEQRIGEHKIQLQGLLRDLDKIKSEQHDAVADMITAKQEKDIADMISGIAQDGTAEELQRMRQLRQEVKAEAKISKEMSGLDTRAEEEEFLEYARTHTANDEFDALVGLGAETDSAASESPLPEAEKEGEGSGTPLPE
jgi:phage shock protein A